jgi:hypothetical protein
MLPDKVEHFSEVTDGPWICCQDPHICGGREVWRLTLSSTEVGRFMLPP